MIDRNRGRALLGFVLPMLAAGCGAGVAGVVATSGSSGGGSTPTLTAFEVESPKESPATLVLEASASVLAATPLSPGGSAATDRPVSLAAADLDGDGHQDLVSANSCNNLTVFFQASPGSFEDDVLTLGGLETTSNRQSVAAADLDRDGDLDLVAYTGQGLTVFFQLSRRNFGGTPLTFGRGVSVAAADLDGNGDQDLVSAN